MTEKIKWQEELEIKKGLLQGDFEKMEDALFKMPNVVMLMRGSELSTVRGAYLRSAIQAGWIVSPECKSLIDEDTKERLYLYDGLDVSKMHPAKVSWLGKAVIEAHDAVMSEDPKN